MQIPVTTIPAPHRSTIAVSASRAREEFFNSLTHGVGFLLTLFGVPALIACAAGNGDAWTLVGCSVYGGGLTVMYLVSTIYHGVAARPSRDTWRRLDHICIFLFIAATYTPFALVHLRGPTGWLILSVVWSIALVGITCKLVLEVNSHWVSTVSYVIMGWLCLLVVKPMIESVPLGAVLWLFAGGVTYTLGTVFYIRDHRPYYHVIWHCFVLAGSACHYVAIYSYVIPPIA